MNIALISSNTKKKLMENFCINYKHILMKHNLYATGTTGKLIEDISNLKVIKFIPGNLGGKYQIATQISQNNIDIVIFFKDHNYYIKNYKNINDISEDSYHINDILKLCGIYNIPIATNLATAEAILFTIEKTN